MGDLLKEAIADAKAVRETALQNAKMALEEAFTPQLKSMLSAKLKEDELEEADPVLEDEFEDEEEFSDEEGGEEYGDEEDVPADEMSYEDEMGDEMGDEEGGEEEFGGEDEEEGGLDLEAIIREL